MQKLNFHVLTLLAALVFCVCLINMGAGRNAEKTVEDGITHIPTLSSSVINYSQQLILPVAEEDDSAPSNEYLDIIRFELENGVEAGSPPPAEKKVITPSVEQDKPTVSSVKKKQKKVAVKKKRKKDYVERWAVVTAYCPCSKCCGYATPGRTSTGRSAWKPGIAADPRALPYGTEIYVKGYGRRRVDDTGGAMRRSWRRKGVLHLDIRMTYHYQAVRWGRKMMKVRIYKK